MTGKTAATPDTTSILWDVAPQPSGTSLLKLSGDLKPGWLGKLSSYLTQEKINVICGTALKSGPLFWEAEFEIGLSNNNINRMSGFDPVPALISSHRQAETPSIQISEFMLEPSKEHGGCIYAEISGNDCIGFLYGMLRNFSFYSLFPIQLEVSTNGDTAFDRFWLKGIGSSAPIKDDLLALRERLQCSITQ